MLNQPGPIRLVCPACGRFLATLDGASVELPPCQCGVQTTIRVSDKRRNWSRPAGLLREIEVK